MKKKKSQSRKGLDQINIVTVFMIFLILFIFSFEGIVSYQKYVENKDSNTEEYKNLENKREKIEPIVGYGEENNETTFTLELTKSNIIHLTLILIWTDEEPPRPRIQTNQPDSFQLKVKRPWDGKANQTKMEENEIGKEKQISLTIDVPKEEDGAGIWEIIIQGGDCRDHIPRMPFVDNEDKGNDFTVSGSYQFWG